MKTSTKFNYEVVIGGQEINIVANVMTESQARTILEHFVKSSGLKDIFFKCKRLTPEPFTGGGSLFDTSPALTSSAQNITFDTSGWPAQ